METKNNDNELDIASGADLNVITLSTDVKVTINKVKLKDIGKILKIGKLVMAGIAKAKKDSAMRVAVMGPVDTIETLDAADSDRNSTIVDLISDHFDTIVKVTSMLSSAEETELNDMELDDAVLVIMGVVETNKRFFTERVVKSLGPEAYKMIAGLLNKEAENTKSD